jgi:hypothetical protein
MQARSTLLLLASLVVGGSGAARALDAPAGVAPRLHVEGVWPWDHVVATRLQSRAAVSVVAAGSPAPYYTSFDMAS